MKTNMLKRTCLIILLLLVMLTGYPKQNKCDNGHYGNKDSVMSVDEKNISSYIEFVKSFYSKYIHEIYNEIGLSYLNPSYSKVDKNKYILNTEKYINKIRELGFFTEYYLKQDSILLEDCSKAMLDVDWEYEPEPEFNLEPCNFLWKDRIVGGQGEEITGISIIHSKFIELNKALIKFDVYESFGKLCQINIIVINICDDKFKIDKIEIVKYFY